MADIYTNMRLGSCLEPLQEVVLVYVTAGSQTANGSIELRDINFVEDVVEYECVLDVRLSAYATYLARDVTTFRGFLNGLPSGVKVLAGSLNGVCADAIPDRRSLAQPLPLSRDTYALRVRARTLRNARSVTSQL